MSILHHRPSAEKSKSLIESRHDYYSDQALLSVYDTYDCANKVVLSANSNILYCGMITGKLWHDNWQESRTCA